jgi:hypothetical protein
MSLYTFILEAQASSRCTFSLIYIYICIYIYMNTHACEYMYVPMHVCMHMTYICMYLRTTHLHMFEKQEIFEHVFRQFVDLVVAEIPAHI